METRRVATLPEGLTAPATRLESGRHKLLLRKREWLVQHNIQVPGLDANATLLFAQEEGGTAVCIHSDGILLTCSHCVAETEAEYDPGASHWLLFASGGVVEARCEAWDPKSDLALLRIVSAQPSVYSTEGCSGFPALAVAPDTPKVGSSLICIGHPGSEDLEAVTPGRKTNYDLLHVSRGSYRGCAEGQNPLDNCEIGALKHDCWTYWGHSGAPLVEIRSGAVVGLHSSWEVDTGMRRGVPLVAIRHFLAMNRVDVPDKDRIFCPQRSAAQGATSG